MISYFKGCCQSFNGEEDKKTEKTKGQIDQKLNEQSHSIRAQLSGTNRQQILMIITPNQDPVSHEEELKERTPQFGCPDPSNRRANQGVSDASSFEKRCIFPFLKIRRNNYHDKTDKNKQIIKKNLTGAPPKNQNEKQKSLLSFASVQPKPHEHLDKGFSSFLMSSQVPQKSSNISDSQEEKQKDQRDLLVRSQTGHIQMNNHNKTAKMRAELKNSFELKVLEYDRELERSRGSSAERLQVTKIAGELTKLTRDQPNRSNVTQLLKNKSLWKVGKD